jgi:hypothetical protein
LKVRAGTKQISKNVVNICCSGDIFDKAILNHFKRRQKVNESAEIFLLSSKIINLGGPFSIAFTREL